MFYRLFAVLFLTLITQVAMALDNNFKVWLQYQYAGHFKFNPDIQREFETQVRMSRLGKNELDLLLIRGGLGYEVMPAVNVLGGYEWNMGYKASENNVMLSAHEYIIYEQIGWSASPSLNFRTRLEQRERSNQDTWNVRVRFKAISIAQKPLFADFQPMISDEVFLLLNHPDWVSENTFDQNRLFIGFQVRMTQTLWWQLGYINQYIERNHNTGSVMNHIASVSLAYL